MTKTKKVIAGIDYSITGPAVTVCDSDDESFLSCKHFYLTDTLKYSEQFLGCVSGSLFPAYKTEEERFDSISAWAMKICEDHGVEEVWIEGYSMGSKGKVFNLAENCGLLKHKIWKSRIPFHVVPPTTVKKFATGKGNSDKQAMHDAFVKETGVNLHQEITPLKKDVSSPVSDVVDSYFIMRYGRSK